MTIPVTMRRHWPLLAQMLWPLLAIEVMLLATIVTWYWHESSQRIQTETMGRAELIAQSIEQRGQSTSAMEALNRLAESFGATRDVEEISVVERTNRLIRNSSNPFLVGTTLDNHPDESSRIQLSSKLNIQRITQMYSGYSYIYLMPTMLPPVGKGHTSRKAIIMVRLNVSHPWHMLWRDIIAFALTGGVLVCATILLFYGMLYIHIYRPLTLVCNIMHRFTGGQRNIAFPVMGSSEFHNLATSLQQLLIRQTENEEQLTGYTNRMELLTMEMETARDEALRANLMKSEFLATMSHEIRTPMNGVIGMTDLLLESGLTGKQAHYARTVQQSAESLLSLIDDILDFSKIEAGRIELEKTPFTLTDIIGNVGNILAIKARDKSLELVMESDTSLPTQYVGDPARLRQVLLNLLGNAIKFTHHGYVMLSVRAAASAPASFTPGIPFPLEIQVRDTGVGIPPEMQKRVFEKFIQADSSTTRKYGGTGLGLAICQQLIQLMGGTINLQSAVNEGTTFTIHLTLPLGNQRDNQPDYPELTGKRILVIDDLPINLTVMQKQLQHLGMDITPALNGKQALEHAEAAIRRHQPFDLFLIDYLMPVQNGEQVATAIRRFAEYTNTPMIMMSASDGQGYQKRFAELGFSALLAKPLSLETLAETLSCAISNDGKPSLQSSTAAPITKGTYAGRRVLVADDNRSNREYIATLLEEMGFSVDEAVNGTVALTKITEGERYDLVLMDCEMPELDGRTATRNIRRKLSAEDLPILALTGHTDARELELCRAVGMNDCLAKPLRRADLEQALHKWLPLSATGTHQAQLRGRNILLVEDNRFNREFMTELLATAGANVYTADNGKESLTALGRHPFIDAVLMDCQMPEMDGYEATEKIRQRQAAGEWPYMPIIALTANAMKGDREKCLAVGMDDYLTKPVNRQQLFATIAGWLGRTAPFPAPAENLTQPNQA